MSLLYHEATKKKRLMGMLRLEFCAQRIILRLSTCVRKRWHEKGVWAWCLKHQLIRLASWVTYMDSSCKAVLGGKKEEKRKVYASQKALSNKEKPPN
eukprot:1137470-Pelagomonas_calceolata.AAC.7